jgi:hypothetical protein
MHHRGYGLPLSGSGCQLIGVSIYHDHMPALCAEDVSGGQSNPARRAGNECSFHSDLLLPDCAAGSRQKQAVKMFQLLSETVM